MHSQISDQNDIDIQIPISSFNPIMNITNPIDASESSNAVAESDLTEYPLHQDVESNESDQNMDTVFPEIQLSDLSEDDE